MMIGDSLTADITGGRAYGMSTCWYVPSVEKYREEVQEAESREEEEVEAGEEDYNPDAAE